MALNSSFSCLYFLYLPPCLGFSAALVINPKASGMLGRHYSTVLASVAFFRKGISYAALKILLHSKFLKRSGFVIRFLPSDCSDLTAMKLLSFKLMKTYGNKGSGSLEFLMFSVYNS